MLKALPGKYLNYTTPESLAGSSFQRFGKSMAQGKHCVQSFETLVWHGLQPIDISG